MTVITDRSWLAEVAKGNIPGHLGVSRFGLNPNIGTGPGETIWPNGGFYVHPIQERIHNIVGAADDIGTLVTSGTATNNTPDNFTKLFDENADFIAAGVQVDDLILNDTSFEYGTVTEINSANQLTVLIFRCIKIGITPDCQGMSPGNSYRIVNTPDIGAGVSFVQGLNGKFNLVSEFIILNGDVNVPTLKSYRRVFRMEILSAGSNDAAVGPVTATTIGETIDTVSAVIPADRSQSEMALITIPRGFTGLLVSWWGSVNESTSIVSAQMRLEISEVDRPKRLREPIYVSSRASDSQVKSLEVPDVISQMSDIELRAEVSSQNTTVSGGFSLIIIRNNVLNGTAF